MNIKKIIAAAAAAVMAAGICTGVPMGTENEPITVITAEAANSKLKVKLTAYDDGTADLTWDEVDGAYYYAIQECYETIPLITSPYYEIKCAVAVGSKKDFKSKVDFWGSDYFIDVDVKAIPSAKYTIKLPDSKHYKGYIIGAVDKNGKIIGEVSEAVTTLDAKVYSRGSSASTTTTKLAAPKGIKGTVSEDKITLKWNKVSGAKAYRVYKYNSKTGKYVKYKDVTGTTCTVTGLKAGTSYKFKVYALTSKNGKYVQHKASKVVSYKTKEYNTDYIA